MESVPKDSKLWSLSLKILRILPFEIAELTTALSITVMSEMEAIPKVHTGSSRRNEDGKLIQFKENYVTRM